MLVYQGVLFSLLFYRFWVVAQKTPGLPVHPSTQIERSLCRLASLLPRLLEGNLWQPGPPYRFDGETRIFPVPPWIFLNQCSDTVDRKKVNIWK